MNTLSPQRTKANQPSQAKHWCFTWNNPTFTHDEMLELLRPLTTYAVFQLEKSESGTSHYQGYVEFSSRKRLTSIINQLFQAHWTKRQASRMACKLYCQKEDTRIGGPWETCTFPLQSQGKRSDLEEVYRKLRSGQSLASVADEHPATYMRYMKSMGMVKYLAVFDKPKTLYVPKTVHLLYGLTRTGKTQFAYELDKDLYKFQHSKTCWADGYTGQKTLLFDDFAGNIRIDKMLQMLDGYATQVEVKGGMIWLHHDTVVLTTNEDPTSWWEERSDDTREAFFARVTSIKHFHKSLTSEDIQVSTMVYKRGYLKKVKETKIQPMVEEDTQSTLEFDSPMQEDEEVSQNLDWRSQEPLYNSAALFKHADKAFKRKRESNKNTSFKKPRRTIDLTQEKKKTKK